jgi:hypothetical protein
MIKTNKVKIFIASFFIINIPFLLGVENSIAADTAIDSQNSVANAYINVVAPTTNIWSLTAPNFNFGTQTASSSVINSNATGDAPIKIVNLSGTSTSFSLQQSVSDFTLVSSTSVLPTTAFTVSVANSADGKLIGSSNVNIFKQNAVVLRSGTGANGTLTSGAVTAQLTVDGTSKVIITGSYKATITSTLVTGP